jgi:hypothetical protein
MKKFLILALLALASHAWANGNITSLSTGKGSGNSVTFDDPNGNTTNGMLVVCPACPGGSSGSSVSVTAILGQTTLPLPVACTGCAGTVGTPAYVVLAAGSQSVTAQLAISGNLVAGNNPVPVTVTGVPAGSSADPQYVNAQLLAPVAGQALSISKCSYTTAASAYTGTIKALAGVVMYATLQSVTGTAGGSGVTVHFYNSASNPTIGAGTVVTSIQQISNSNAILNCQPQGCAFSSGIAYTVTGGPTDTDATSISSPAATLNVVYK